MTNKTRSPVEAEAKVSPLLYDARGHFDASSHACVCVNTGVEIQVMRDIPGYAWRISGIAMLSRLTSRTKYIWLFKNYSCTRILRKIKIMKNHAVYKDTCSQVLEFSHAF